jgi:DNA primase
MEKRITEYLSLRGIVPNIWERMGVVWNGSEIVIPIHDASGNHLFSKYRRDPECQNKDIPKYRYDKGSKAALYNIAALHDADNIWIVEGELDVLRLMSCGIDAVSSTGGSKMFKEEWIPLFDGKNVVICYDQDKAGIEGALKVHAMLPQSSIAFLPKEGYDVTDYLKEYSKIDLVKLPRYILEFPEDKSQKDTKRLTAFYQDLSRKLRNKQIPDTFATIMMERCLAQIDKPKIKQAPLESSDLTSLKKIPISQFIKLSKDNSARCLWHEEKTPSMKYYPDTNSLYCFGCGSYGDIISVIQKLENCSFKVAVAYLKRYANV